MQRRNLDRVVCPDCESIEEQRLPRRDFISAAGGAVIAGGFALAGLPVGRVWAAPRATAEIAATTSSPESLVKVLFETLSPGQREKICFPWNHQDPERGLLRTRVSANWDITDYYIIDDDFYTKDQQHLVRNIFEGIINPEWHSRIDKQLEDDAGGYGEQNSIAIFGTPGSDKFEFVMTGRHMTIRCDGNSAEHVAFGGPIFYGHAAEAFDEEAHHPGNVFWPQAKAANKLYEMLDKPQRAEALVRRGLPRESRVGFRGKSGEFRGLAVAEMSSDQKEHLQEVLAMIVEPYRQGDRDEVTQCIAKLGGLDACHLAFYSQGDIGHDSVWDNWRLEGPAFVWHYRGAPHVHVWVNVADDPSVKLNA